MRQAYHSGSRIKAACGLTLVMLSIGGFILTTGVVQGGSVERWVTLHLVICQGYLHRAAKGPWTKSSTRPWLCCRLRWVDTLRLALDVAGLDESLGKAKGSFAGARCLSVLFDICWSLGSIYNYRSFTKGKAGRFCSHTRDRNADVSFLVPLSGLSVLLSGTASINPQALWHSVCHTDEEFKKIKMN